MPRQVLKELCLWPTLLSLELLRKLLAGLNLWLYAEACKLLSGKLWELVGEGGMDTSMGGGH